jgi:hypothetical protein
VFLRRGAAPQEFNQVTIVAIVGKVENGTGVLLSWTPKENGFCR